VHDLTSSVIQGFPIGCVFALLASSGLDRNETRALTDTLRVVHEERGIAMLLVEHDVDMVLDLVSRIYVLDLGTLIAAGPADEVLHDAKVRKAYLGDLSPTSGGTRAVQSEVR
jgi:ABC-type methionine transport system ATPase subunit